REIPDGIGASQHDEILHASPLFPSREPKPQPFPGGNSGQTSRRAACAASSGVVVCVSRTRPRGLEKGKNQECGSDRLHATSSQDQATHPMSERRVPLQPPTISTSAPWN